MRTKESADHQQKGSSRPIVVVVVDVISVVVTIMNIGVVVVVTVVVSVAVNIINVVVYMCIVVVIIIADFLRVRFAISQSNTRWARVATTCFQAYPMLQTCSTSTSNPPPMRIEKAQPGHPQKSECGATVQRPLPLRVAATQQ